MFTDIAAYLRYFDGVRRRTERDVLALPAEAAPWRPPVGSGGEAGWGIGEIVGHIGASRLYFARAYRDEGWIMEPPELDRDDQWSWLPWLRLSAERFVAMLEGTPDEWLARRIAMIDTPGSLSGARVLMMMLEHEVHHRSQIDAYAGLQGWPVPDIFERSAEAVAALQPAQRGRHSPG